MSKALEASKALGNQLRGKDDLEEEIDISLNAILVSMIKGDEDLELKTEILRPKDVSALNMYAEVCESEELTETSELLVNYRTDYLRNMVSFKRKSREELIKAFRSLSEKETVRMTFTEKMGTNLK